MLDLMDAMPSMYCLDGSELIPLVFVVGGVEAGVDDAMDAVDAVDVVDAEDGWFG